MAHSFRNSNARLSVIADTLSRLRLHCSGPLFILRYPAWCHSRAFTETRLGFRESLTSANFSTAIPLNHAHGDPAPKPNNDTHPRITELPSPPPPQSNKTSEAARTRMASLRRRFPWKDEEDRMLFQLVKEGKGAHIIYANHLHHRTYQAVVKRVNYASKAARLQEQQAREGIREGDPDVAKSVAGEEGAMPLRIIYGIITKSLREERREIGKSEQMMQWPRGNRKGLLHCKTWTREEVELLERLVEKYIDIPDPHIWYEVSIGNIDGSTLLRDPAACRRRWRYLHPLPPSRIGSWSMQEELRLQEAISEQLDGKYQVAVDILAGQYANEAKKGRQPHSFLGKQRPELQQLPAQADLPVLKEGSRPLRMLNWVTIAEKVNSRKDHDCRDHFYSVYHNGNIGPWSEKELRRAREGVELFGNDYRRIADYVGKRSIVQVTKMVYKKRFSRRNSVDSEEDRVVDIQAIP